MTSPLYLTKPALAILIAVMFISAPGLQAQNKSSDTDKGGDVRNITKITLILSGLSQEMRIGKFQTIHAHALMNLSALTYSSPNGDMTETRLYFDPSVILGYRYYYNYKQRRDKGKRTEMNSMNYISIAGQFVSTKSPLTKNYYEFEERRPVYAVGALWGMQRNFEGRFSLDLNVGPAVEFGKERSFTAIYNPATGNIDTKEATVSRSEVTVLSQLTLGFWLNRR